MPARAAGLALMVISYNNFTQSKLERVRSVVALHCEMHRRAAAGGDATSGLKFRAN